MNISDEAVEAARAAFVGFPLEQAENGTLDLFRAALEAAAPHLMAPVLDLCDEADNRRGSSMYCKLTTYEVRQAVGAGE